MKFGKYKNYLFWGVTAFSVIAASMLLYYLLFHFEGLKKTFSYCLDVLSPILIGLLIAYCLSPILRFMEETVLARLFRLLNFQPSPKHGRLIRSLLILFTYLIVMAGLYSLISAIIPEIVNSFGNLMRRLPYYMRSTEKMITRLFSNSPELQETFSGLFLAFTDKLNDLLTNTLLPAGSDFVVNLSNQVFSLVGTALDVIVGAIIAIYLLYNKERYIGLCKKALYSAFSLETATGLIKDLKYVNKEFSGFLTGKVIDSILIGLICYVATNIIGTPYALLVSLIIGVTNIIPFFGPFLGAVPCLILILMIQPLQAFYFLLFVIVLQQFDGNFLGPKILGRTTGVSSFLIIISILIGSGIWGVFGMIIAVPICAIICTLVRNNVARRLKLKELPSEDDFYIQSDYIDTSSGQFVPISTSIPVGDSENLFHFRERASQHRSKPASQKTKGAQGAAKSAPDDPPSSEN